MKHRILFLLIFFAAAHIAVAQQKSLVIFGVSDKITGDNYDDAQIELMLNDSIRVPYKRVPRGTGTYCLEFNYRAGDYTVLAARPGYGTGKKTFTMKTSRSTTIGIGNIHIEKVRQQNLDEVTVKTTRIKMLMKGDTIVYDAAAFELAEGSMLDALVAQLPGAELRDGQIIVNGKVMESLLINGEDFFSGNPKVALQNLPSYTVKDIKVYDRAAKDDYLKTEAQKLINHEEHMVMDVVLKKKYERGLLGNVDMGYGLPDDRYIGKAFMLGYYGRTRIAAFANINNIKDTQTGSAGGNGWGGGWPQDGSLDLAMGGIDLMHKQGKFSYTGNATLTHEEPLVMQKISAVSFYEGGDIYSRALAEARDRKTHLMSSHSLEYSGDRAYTTFKPTVDYMRNKSRTLARSASFSAAPAESYRLQSLDSLFAPNWSSTNYAASLLNRQYREQEGNKDWLRLTADGYTKITLPDYGNDMIELKLNGKYDDNLDDPYVSYNRIYGAASENFGTGENTLQRRDNRSKNYNVQTEASYTWWCSPYKAEKMNALVIKPYIKVGRSYSDNKNRIDQLTQMLGAGGDMQIIPPSAINPELLSRDLENSYNSEHSTNSYTPGVNMLYAYIPSVTSGIQYSAVLELEDNMRQERLNYDRNLLDTAVTRFSHLLTPTMALAYQKYNDKRNVNITFQYKYNEQLPNIYYSLGLTNSSDPYSIYRYNPNLKRPQSHSVNLLYRNFAKQTYRNFYADVSYSRTDRAIANAKRYDRNTGITTWRNENINGNWNANANTGYSTPLGKSGEFQFSTSTGASFVHSVDYATDSDEMMRSEVDNLNLSERLSLTYKLGKHQLSWQGSVSWQRSFSQRATFDDISAFNFGSSLNGTFNLPYNWQIASDMNFVCRTGYSDDNLNSAHWVWNASLAKTMMKGNLTLKLNAVDILDQISNVTYNVNAQGQTEVWTNALPSYVMLHAIYRFNVMPKR